MTYLYICIVVTLFYISDAQTSQGCTIASMECPNANITFWMYTTVTRAHPHELRLADRETLNSAPWIPDAPIKVLIHGYTGDKDSTPNPEIRSAYMHSCDYNIISVDYKCLAMEACYYHGANNVKQVGKCTAQLLDALVSVLHFPLSSVHVIGFGLGAHMAGAISHYLWAGKLDRITGLDPALSLFVTNDRLLKLDPGDAKFVDVLHTNALEKGKLEVSGTVDFYANGGLAQPGCLNSKITKIGCDHSRAAEYYAESITTSTGFYGSRCLSWLSYMVGWCKFTLSEETLFGEDVSKKAEGLYFLSTAAQRPYSRGRVSKSFIPIEENEFMNEGQENADRPQKQHWDTFYFIINWLETVFDRVAIV